MAQLLSIYVLLLTLFCTQILSQYTMVLYNSPQCATDESFCTVACPQGLTRIGNCEDVGNGTSGVYYQGVECFNNSCEAQQDPSGNASPCCQITCQDQYPAPPTQIVPPPVSTEACKKIQNQTFVITQKYMNLDGANRPVLAINGMIPGPTIELNLGEALHIHVINHLPEGMAVSFHWYGLPQLNFPYFDGVANITECPACPGQTIDYVFCPNVTGTFWYHSTANSQRVDGLFGTLIVRDANEESNLNSKYPNYKTDLIVLMTEWYHRSSSDIENEINNMDWIGDFLPGRQSALVCNGVSCMGCAENCTTCCSEKQSYYENQGYGYCGSDDSAPGVTRDCSDVGRLIYNVFPDSSYRLRFISAASSYPIRVSIDEHPMLIIAVDGNHLVEPYSVSEFDMSMGQRYDVIVFTNQTVGNYFIRGEGPRAFGAYAYLSYQGAGDPYSYYSNWAAPENNYLTEEATQPYIVINLNSSTEQIISAPTVELTMKIGCCENLTCTAKVCNDPGAPSPTHSNSPSPSISSLNNHKSTSISTSTSPSSSTSPSTDKSKILQMLNYDNNNNNEKMKIETDDVFLPIPPEPIFPGTTFGINDFNRTHSVDSYCNYPDGLVKRHACWMRLLSNVTNIYETKSPFITPILPPILAAYEAGDMTWPPPAQTIELNRDDVVRIVINNEDVHSVHSLHLHGQSFFVLGQSQQLSGPYNNDTDFSLLNLKNPMERDTLYLVPSSWAVIQFTATNAGTWYFHDQLQWNLNAGMGIMINEITKDLTLPPGNSMKPCGSCQTLGSYAPVSPSETPTPTVTVSATATVSTSNSTQTDTTDCSSGLSTGVWVAITVGVLLVMALLGFAITLGSLYLYFSKKQKV